MTTTTTRMTKTWQSTAATRMMSASSKTVTMRTIARASWRRATLFSAKKALRRARSRARTGKTGKSCPSLLAGGCASATASWSKRVSRLTRRKGCESSIPSRRNCTNWTMKTLLQEGSRRVSATARCSPTRTGSPPRRSLMPMTSSCSRSCRSSRWLRMVMATSMSRPSGGAASARRTESPSKRSRRRELGLPRRWCPTLPLTSCSRSLRRRRARRPWRPRRQAQARPPSPSLLRQMAARMAARRPASASGNATRRLTLTSLRLPKMTTASLRLPKETARTETPALPRRAAWPSPQRPSEMVKPAPNASASASAATRPSESFDQTIYSRSNWMRAARGLNRAIGVPERAISCGHVMRNAATALLLTRGHAVSGLVGCRRRRSRPTWSRG
mmetsp:Transcript_4433/g.11344  ORF Transcript_4433/g.11344 Transcript_4433/m.11344 type:complete len:389 (+) Transcript_4433:554-1720(+)